MKKVLIIAYAFPPVGGGGVQRPTKFVKYLREFGWEPLVLTVANPSVPLTDASLLKDIPDGVKVFKARTLEPSYTTKQHFVTSDGGLKGYVRNWLKSMAAQCLLPDTQVLWWPGLIAKILKIRRIEKPDCIFITAPPFSSFIPVVILGKMFNIPVVIDFRDEWTYSRQQWEHAVKSSFAFMIDRFLESYAIRSCTKYIAVNESYVYSLDVAYPKIAPGKGVVITNGYDTDDFERVQRHDRDNDKIIVVYAGTVWNGNSLENFVKALKILKREHPELSQTLTVRIFGRVVGEHSEYLSDPEIEDIIVLNGYQDHERIIEEMCNADALLLSITDLPNANKIILGKVFEYMASGSHILALAPQGETRTLLMKSYNKVSFANPDRQDDIVNAIRDIISSIREIRTVTSIGVEQYSRCYLTGRLANVLSSLS